MSRHPDAPASTAPTTEGVEPISVPITEVIAKNGLSVKCTYLNHPAFDGSQNLWLSLHLIFVKGCPEKSHTWGYALRVAFCFLLDFVREHNNSHPSTLWLTHLQDLTAPVFKAFENYLRRIGKDTRKAQQIKTALKEGARTIKAIPPLALAPVLVDPSEPTEPLNEDGMETLAAATKTVIDKLLEKLEVRKIIDSVEPYTYEEITSFREAKLSKEDILTWCKYRIDNSLFIDKQLAVARLKKCTDPKIKKLLEKPSPHLALRDYYLKHKVGVSVPEGYEQSLKDAAPYYRMTLAPYRVVKTFVVHGYPLELDPMVRRTEYHTNNLINYAQLDNVVKHLIHKLSRTGSYRTKYDLPPMLSVDEHLSLYYPTLMEMSALTASMMIQAGWNKESVTDIDPEDFEHPLTATIENRLKIIRAEKFRSQGTDLPYDKPSTMIARSDSDNPYSAYNLILLAKDLSAPLAKYTEGRVDPLRNKPLNTMLSFLRMGAGNKFESTATVDYRANFATGIKEFLKQYEVIDGGVRLTSAKSLTPRLRNTWVFYNAPATPSSFLSFLLGHESRDTTDESYDSSPAANRRRMVRLRSALEEIMDLLKARKIKGLLSRKAQAKASKKVVFFHLPPFDRALWGCADQEQPDWPGAPCLKKGEKCTALENCMGCSQLWIIEDSLPYLYERLNHVEELLRDTSHLEFGNKLEAERDRIEEILDNWPDEQDKRNAIDYRNQNKPLLPRSLEDLKLIFKTDDTD